MSFASGAAMFNRCFKPAAIEIFTDHLRKYPNDYKALMWRSKAYRIVNKPEDAIRDLETAIDVSSGVKKELALAEKALLLGRIDEFANIVRRMTEENPDFWEGWLKLGRYHQLNDNENAAECFRIALDVARENGEMNDPEICWINQSLGQIWLDRGEVEIAADYFRAAVESSPTHTISHIGLCQTQLLQGNVDEARSSFITAQELNPELVQSQFEADTFDEFLVKLERKMQQQQQQKQMSQANIPEKKQKKSKSARSNGGSGSGGSSGSDSDENNGSGIDHVNKKWKQLQKEAPCIMLYRSHKYVQSKCGNYWYSKDTAGHGGAAFKRYKNTRNSIRFIDSLDAKMEPMVNKHESREGSVIYKNEMAGVRGK